MKRIKLAVVIVISLTLMLTLVRSVDAQSPNESQTFFAEECAGLSIIVNATRETVPGGNITINLWLNCTSVGMKVICLNLSVYGFHEGREKTLFYVANVSNDIEPPFNWTKAESYNVSVPLDVWGTTYCQLRLKYTIILDDPRFYIVYKPPAYEPAFPITVVRNVAFEQIKEEFGGLFKKLMEQLREFRRLNESYNELKKDYTSMQDTMKELDSARRVAAILGITTVFFVVTTVYLVMRRPKEYW